MASADITFMYFRGCPHSAPSLENLKAAIAELGLNASLSILEVNTPAQAADAGFLGSPSILVDGRDLESGLPPQGSNFSCRLYTIGGKRTGLLPKDYIKARLELLLAH